MKCIFDTILNNINYIIVAPKAQEIITSFTLIIIQSIFLMHSAIPS